MARLDFGSTDAEALFMLKATVQTHENVLFGSTSEEVIIGVVPTVHDLMIKIGFSKTLGILMNALILLILGVMAWRNENKPPVIIYQQAPQAQQPQHKSFNDQPRMQAEQPSQDAQIPIQP